MDARNMDPEPKFNPEDSYDWVQWANRELSRYKQSDERLDTELARRAVTIDRLRVENKDKSELIESYRKIINSRTSLQVFQVGERVYIGPENLEAKVLLVTISEGNMVNYSLGYWFGNSWEEVRLPASEVRADTPLKPCPPTTVELD